MFGKSHQIHAAYFRWNTVATDVLNEQPLIN